MCAPCEKSRPLIGRSSKSGDTIGRKSSSETDLSTDFLKIQNEVRERLLGGEALCGLNFERRVNF